MALDIRSSELEHNFIKERVKCVEKYLGEFGSKLQCYIYALAHVRDKGDEVAECISSFASKENCNQTLRLRLGEFSDVLVSLEEYREAQIERISVKVIHEFENFKPLCKQTLADIKKCFDARNSEFRKKNELEKARSKNPPNWQKIAEAEKKVNLAQEEAIRLTEDMRRIVDRFERKKLEGLQRIFLEFIKIEMIFHTKAIEQNTVAYNILKSIKVEEDLHEFNSHFKAYKSLDMESLMPVNSITVPKAGDTNAEGPSPSHISQEPQVFRGVQETARSVFTLKASTAQTADNSDCSSESFIHKAFEPTD